MEDKRTMIGHFQKEEIGEKVKIGMPGMLPDVG